MRLLLEPPPADLAQQLTSRNYISYSAISTYLNCPLRYYFRYVQGISEDTVSSSLVFGGAIHAAIELHFTTLSAQESRPDLDTLLDAFWASWNERAGGSEIRFGKGEDLNSVAAVAERVLRAFQASTATEPNGCIVGIEEELRGQVTDDTPELLARIDLLTECRDEVLITDFKTSRSRWSDGQAQNSADQLLLYSELVSQVLPDKPIGLRFVVLTKTKSPEIQCFEVQRDRQRVERIKRLLSVVWRQIRSRQFYPSPSPTQCPSCPFREQCRQW